MAHSCNTRVLPTRREALGGGRVRHTDRAITEETPLIPDRSADASRSLRFAGNTRAAAVGPAAVSARPRTPANPPEDARGGTSAAEAAARGTTAPIFLPGRRRIAKNRRVFIEGGDASRERERERESACVRARARAYVCSSFVSFARN